MATVSAPQYNQLKNSNMNRTAVHSAKEATVPMHLPDLRQVTVLPKTDWFRIQDKLNQVNEHNENILRASQERYALHLRSKEEVKFWSNTIAGERQKKLEAKKIREEIEEEEKKRIDLEEAQYQQQKRKEAIEEAKRQLYYQTDRVKGFHSNLLLTEVLKEREAQIQLKRRKQVAAKDVDRVIMAEQKLKDEEALEQERQTALQKKKDREKVAERLKEQMREHEAVRENEKLNKKREAEELQQLKRLHGREQWMCEQNRQEEKRNIMKAHLEHLADQKLMRDLDLQKQEAEEECRRLFSSAKQKMMKMRKEKEAEMFGEMQRHRERMVQQLATQLQEKTTNDEELIANAVTRREARLEREQREKEAKHKAMLESITAHREAMRQEQEQRTKQEKQRALEMLLAKKEADKQFLEKQQLKAQKMKGNALAVQDFHVQQMVERKAKKDLLKKEELDFDAKNTELIAEEERKFQSYAEEVISAAEEAKRITLPLRKAAREGIGGGAGPIFGGLRPSYQTHDSTGVELPKYISGTTQDIKDLYETADMQQAKKRLGFSW